MLRHTKLIVITTFALALQACVTSAPPAPTTRASYFWLPLLGISAEDVRRRDQIDALLMQRGYVRGDAIALSISTDAERDGDGSLGLGVYSGGYTYYAPAPAPSGAVVVEAFDAATLQRLWRVRLSRAVLGDEPALRRALDAALRKFPRPDAAGRATGELPDARAPMHEAGSATIRSAT